MGTICCTTCGFCVTKRLNCRSQWNSHYKYLKLSVISQIGPLGWLSTYVQAMTYDDHRWKMTPPWRYLSYPETSSFISIPFVTTEHNPARYRILFDRNLSTMNFIAQWDPFWLRPLALHKVSIYLIGKIEEREITYVQSIWKANTSFWQDFVFVSCDITHIPSTFIASFPQRVTWRIPIRLQDLNGHLQQGSKLYDFAVFIRPFTKSNLSRVACCTDGRLNLSATIEVVFTFHL